MQKKKGISLIVLVITIMVMTILTGMVILNLTDSDIINNTSKTVFVSDMKYILDEYNGYLAFYVADGKEAEDLNVSASDIRTIIDIVPDELYNKNKLEIINGELTYMVDTNDKYDLERATWACEAGVKVNGYTSCSDIVVPE